MFLPWEAFIRKMIIHSTDMCQELCWVYRDEGWLLPLENEHPDQREIRSVGEGLTEDGWWSETAVHSSQSLEMIVSVKESGWTSWIALARVTAYEGGVRFAQVQLEGKQHEQLQGSSILRGKHGRQFTSLLPANSMSFAFSDVSMLTVERGPPHSTFLVVHNCHLLPSLTLHPEDKRSAKSQWSENLGSTFSHRRYSLLSTYYIVQTEWILFKGQVLS